MMQVRHLLFYLHKIKEKAKLLWLPGAWGGGAGNKREHSL